MRIRSIKPEFWRSPDIVQLSLEDRLLFIGLWSYVDDNGVGRDEEALIAADLFPHDLSVSPHGVLKRIHGGLKRLSEAGLITRYIVKSRQFFEVRTWERHQKINRPSAPRFPRSDHPEAVLTEPSVSPQWEFSAGAGDQGAGDQDSLAQPSGSSVRRFDEFWNTYPRKVGKQKARAKYAAAAKRADEETIIAGAQRLATDPNLPERQYIPHPTTWLERDGWEDEPLPPRQQPRTFGEQKLDRINALTASYLQEGGDPWTSEPPNALPPNSSASSSATTGETTSTSLPLPHLRQA